MIPVCANTCAFFLPMSSIKAVFAKENQQGMFFNERVMPSDDETVLENEATLKDDVTSVSDEESFEGKRNSVSRTSSKKKTSHLKVIK